MLSLCCHNSMAGNFAALQQLVATWSLNTRTPGGGPGVRVGDEPLGRVHSNVQDHYGGGDHARGNRITL